MRFFGVASLVGADFVQAVGEVFGGICLRAGELADEVGGSVIAAVFQGEDEVLAACPDGGFGIGLPAGGQFLPPQDAHLAAAAFDDACILSIIDGGAPGSRDIVRIAIEDRSRCHFG